MNITNNFITPGFNKTRLQNFLLQTANYQQASFIFAPTINKI